MASFYLFVNKRCLQAQWAGSEGVVEMSVGAGVEESLEEICRDSWVWSAQEWLNYVIQYFQLSLY